MERIKVFSTPWLHFDTLYLHLHTLYLHLTHFIYTLFALHLHFDTYLWWILIWLLIESSLTLLLSPYWVNWLFIDSLLTPHLSPYLLPLSRNEEFFLIKFRKNWWITEATFLNDFFHNCCRWESTKFLVIRLPFPLLSFFAPFVRVWYRKISES